MDPLKQFPSQLSQQIRYVLTDIDETLTVLALPFDTSYAKPTAP